MNLYWIKWRIRIHVNNPNLLKIHNWPQNLGLAVVVVTPVEVISKLKEMMSFPFFIISFFFFFSIIISVILLIPFHWKSIMLIFKDFLKHYFISLKNTKNVDVHFTISNYLLFSHVLFGWAYFHHKRECL